MSNRYEKYAVNNLDVVNKYWDTDNVITRNSYYNILLSRARRGDDEADMCTKAIYVAVNSNSGNNTIVPQEKTMFNSEEIEFIATHAMTPDCVHSLVDVIDADADSITFTLEGKLHTLDDWDIVTTGEESYPVEPPFLIRVIKEYDPDHKITDKIIQDKLGNLFELESFDAVEYIRGVVALKKYIGSQPINEPISLDDTNIPAIEHAIKLVRDYGPSCVRRRIRNSVTPSRLSAGDSVVSRFTITPGARRGMYIFNSSKSAVKLRIENSAKGLWDYDFDLIVDVDKLRVPDMYWPDDQESTERLQLLTIALDVMSLSIALGDKFVTSIDNQHRANTESDFDAFVYDSTSAESRMALTIAVQPMNRHKKYYYDFVDINEITDYRMFTSKTVCLLGVSPTDVNMDEILDSARGVTIVTDDVAMHDRILAAGHNHVTVIPAWTESVVESTWKWFINQPVPFTISLFNKSNEDHLTKYVYAGILAKTEGTVLQQLNSFVNDIINHDNNDLYTYPEELIKVIDLGKSTYSDVDSNIVDLRLNSDGN